MPLLAAVAFAVVLPRMLMLPVSVVDWDESIYALIAQQWLHGHVPFTTVFDHKPMGLYTIFAAFFAVFGDNVIAVRLIALAFVAGTALLLGRAAERQFGHGPWLGALVAALYGFLSLTNGGLASNTEILVNFFVVLALTLTVGARDGAALSVPRRLAVGASLGMAFQVNYLAGILAMGYAAFYLCWIARPKAAGALLRRYLIDGALMLAGFFAIWAILLLPVLLAGDIRDYFGLQQAYLSGYASPASTATILRRTIEAVVPWWPFFALAAAFGIAGAFGGVAARDRRVLGWLVMTAFGLVTASASGYFYQHFFLFALPALVMLAAGFLALVLETQAARVFCAVWLLLMCGAAVLGGNDTLRRGLHASRALLDGRPPDDVARLGRYLSERLAPGETIFVYEQQPFLYFLTRTTPPSRFAFPDFYAFDYLARRFGTTPGELLGKVLDAKPRFVVAGPRRENVADSDAAHDFYIRLEREYRLVSAADPGAPAIVWELARNP